MGISALAIAELNRKMGATARRFALGSLIKNCEDAVVLGVTEGAITATELGADSVITAKILNANVTQAKLASNSVGTAQIINANVTAAKIASDAVITAKILDANVTSAKIAADGVETVNILDLNVTAGKLASDAVTTSKIADGAVTSAKIAAPTAANLNVKRCLLGVFDATAGKTVDTHAIAVTLPNNAIVTRVDYEVITTFTSAGDDATIAITLQSAGDIVAAVAIKTAGNAWDAAIPVVTKVDGTTAKYIKLSDDRVLSAVVGVEALTAGLLRVYADYVMSV